MNWFIPREFKGFKSRIDAGRQLAGHFSTIFRNRRDVDVLFVSPNSVPIAFEVARGIQAACLDVFLVRDIQVPGSAGLSIGYVTSGDFRRIENMVARHLGISEGMADSSADWEISRLKTEERYLRGQRQRIPLTGRTAIIIDDGFSPSSTLLKAVTAVRSLGASKVVLGIPVLLSSRLNSLRTKVDLIVSVNPERQKITEHAWYGTFGEIKNDQVRLHLLPWRDDQRLAA
jgi:putative phosphoribosyl transferase